MRWFKAPLKGAASESAVVMVVVKFALWPRCGMPWPVSKPPGAMTLTEPHRPTVFTPRFVIRIFRTEEFLP
jgi:hypothetical protein